MLNEKFLASENLKKESSAFIGFDLVEKYRIPLAYKKKYLTMARNKETIMVSFTNFPIYYRRAFYRFLFFFTTIIELI